MSKSNKPKAAAPVIPILSDSDLEWIKNHPPYDEPSVPLRIYPRWLAYWNMQAVDRYHVAFPPVMSGSPNLPVYVVAVKG